MKLDDQIINWNMLLEPVFDILLCSCLPYIKKKSLDDFVDNNMFKKMIRNLRFLKNTFPKEIKSFITSTLFNQYSESEISLRLYLDLTIPSQTISIPTGTITHPLNIKEFVDGFIWLQKIEVRVEDNLVDLSKTVLEKMHQEGWVENYLTPELKDMLEKMNEPL